MSTYLRAVFRSVTPLRVRRGLWTLRERIRRALSSLSPIPTMISAGDKKFLAKAARELAPRDGAIVDLGCWMGTSSIALAKGLRDRPGGPGAARVLTHDLFQCWDGWVNTNGHFGIYEVGENFAPEARRYIRDRAGYLVEVRKVDLSSYEWTDGPISLLHVDCMQTFDIARQVTRWFYPSLFPGSILIHQDYKNHYESWIHIIQYRMRSHFELLHTTAVDCTVAFRCVSAVSPAEAASVLDREPSDDEVERCFEWSKDLLAGDVENVAGAHVMEYIHLGRIEQARETVTKYRAAGLAERGRWLRCIQYLDRTRPEVI
jgi:hypothetical protein